MQVVSYLIVACESCCVNREPKLATGRGKGRLLGTPPVVAMVLGDVINITITYFWNMQRIQSSLMNVFRFLMLFNAF